MLLSKSMLLPNQDFYTCEGGQLSAIVEETRVPEEEKCRPLASEQTNFYTGICQWYFDLCGKRQCDFTCDLNHNTTEVPKHYYKFFTTINN